MSYQRALITELIELQALSIYYTKQYGKYYRKGLLNTKRGIRLLSRMQETNIRKRDIKRLIKLIA
jgi:hypothetical protein